MNLNFALQKCALLFKWYMYRRLVALLSFIAALPLFPNHMLDLVVLPLPRTHTLARCITKEHAK